MCHMWLIKIVNTQKKKKVLGASVRFLVLVISLTIVGFFVFEF